VRTGRHHLRDVVGGVAIGAAAAAATRRVWPVAPHEPAATRSALSRSGAGPRPGGAGITVVVNEASGPALGRDRVDLLREALPDAEVVTVDEPDRVQDALEEAARTAEVLGVCGGDGTVNAAASIAHAAGKPLLVVPGGTLNHFAVALGLETIDDAVEAAISGELAAVDVGCIADRPFLNAASFGVYADLVEARERFEGVIGKWPAVVVALARVLLRAEPIAVEIDGERREVWMAFFGNCRYHPAGFAPSWRERLDDGDLDVRLIDAGGWSRLRLVLAVLTGRLGRCRAYESRTASRVDIRSLGGPIGLAADGEVLDGPEAFRVEKLDRPLQVLTRTE
jgi:undecaprenyl-diphosphatase